MKTKEKFSKNTIQSRSDLKKILIKEKKKYMEFRHLIDYIEFFIMIVYQFLKIYIIL